MPIAASAAAVEAHRVDATILLEPALSAALSTGKVRSVGSAFAALAPTFPVSVWMTTRAWATANPDVVRGFTAALRDAAIYVNAHPAESGALVAAATGLSPDALRRMVRTTAGTSLNERDIAALLAAAERYKAVSDVDVRSFLY